MRVLVAVIVGQLVFMAVALGIFRLVGRDPHAAATTTFMAMAIGGGVLAGLLAGAVAATIARRQDLLAPALLAAFVAIGALVSIIRVDGAHWSQWSTAVLMAPAIILGGAVVVRRARRAAAR